MVGSYAFVISPIVGKNTSRNYKKQERERERERDTICLRLLMASSIALMSGVSIALLMNGCTLPSFRV